MLTVAVILILGIGFCLGWKEIAYSYSDIHVADIMSVWPFLICLIISMTVGTGLIMIPDSSNYMTSPDKTFIVLVSMMLTIVILYTMSCHFSTVTIFWGALLAITYINNGSVGLITWILMAMSILIAPALSMACSLLFHKLIQKHIVQKNIHLLMKQLHIKWLAYIGVFVCGIVLTYNYALLVDMLLAPIYSSGYPTWTHWAFVGMMSLVCICPIIVQVYQYPRNGLISNHLASLYAQAFVTLVMNILVPIAIRPIPPVIVSANLLKEGNIIILERGKEMKRVVNMITISVFSPVLSFLVCICIDWFYPKPYIFWIIILFAILVCILTRLSYMQYKKGKNVRRMLSDELKHRDEVNDKLNRLDVMALTSQFDSISREIDFKHKELIDLSLYVQQQRDYITAVGERLKQLAKNDSLESVQEVLTSLNTELKETLRYPPEMEKIYQQVEKMHHDFVCRLQMRCQNLTNRETKLAILLRLGFSSKEIANVLNLETKSVEINRYRLRKKLRLDRSENLVNYLQML